MQQIARQQQATVHKFEPHRVAKAAVLVEEMIVINKVAIARIIRWVDINALDAPRVRHAQRAQCSVIVAFDNQVGEITTASAQVWL